MAHIQNWDDESIEVVRSGGAVLAVVDPWANVIKTGVQPWPAPELLQKIYQSRQVRAYAGAERNGAIKTLGFYSDLQSIHSEDAITWSVFGPLIYVTSVVRQQYVADLLAQIGIVGSPVNAHTWLWRRLPHPDTLVSGGPEIDFGIQTDDVFLLGEAKWRSSVGASQGVDRNKDQVTLRREFCEKYGTRLLPNVKDFVVLGVSWKAGLVADAQTESDGIRLHAKSLTWQQLAEISSHPCQGELFRYVNWKAEHSHPV